MIFPPQHDRFEPDSPKLSYIFSVSYVEGVDKKPHRMALFFSELFYTFERSR